MTYENLSAADPEVFAAVEDELRRQRSSIELIASENFVSLAVMEAVGSPLTNKYAEGLPGKRYYGGCWAVDVVENLARERAKKLFGAGFANVQPHSGAQANYAALAALAAPGDTVMGMAWTTAATSRTDRRPTSRASSTTSSRMALTRRPSSSTWTPWRRSPGRRAPR